MSNFLSENNACGQNLLHLVSFGNSILSEIFRLKDYIPDIYRLEGHAARQKNYEEILMDFSYFNAAEVNEQRIEENQGLQELDSLIRNTYLEILSRFYAVFESTHEYAMDLRRFLDELNRGYHIQQTIENILEDSEGKQLMCESLYIFGVILLVLDYYIPGAVRERLLVSYYRYNGIKAHSDSSIDDICLLLRSTGYTAPVNSLENHNNWPTSGKSSKDVVKNYPEAYFSRFQFNEDFVDMIIGRLRCDDVYNQLRVYPHQSHRSTGLANQAAMLFVCLYFSPKTLHSQVTNMREIVDKFFADNWIVTLYMGITINLIDAWYNFKAAKSAIDSVTEATIVRELCLKHREEMNKLTKKTRHIVNDGVLNENIILEKLSDIVVLIRKCNVTLRWYFTHAVEPIYYINGRNANNGGFQKLNQLQNIIRTELNYKESNLLNFLLDTAQMELIVRDHLRHLVQEKCNFLEKYKKDALNYIDELIQVFSGERPLAKVEVNLKLKSWFEEISKKLTQINVDNIYSSGSILIQIIQALEEVQEFHNMQSNVQAQQYIKDSRKNITKMVQIANVREGILIDIQIISDFSYALLLIDRDFTKIMQENIKLQPKSVIPLRATFLKLASALEIPLMRINQSKSEDLIAVSKYFSSQLANYVRRVLQIIPETMFDIMAVIIELQTNVIKEIPTKIEKDKLKEYAQLEHRYTVAELTRSIAVFTEGILMMETTLVGIIELDPKQLLEDGIRKELVKKLSDTLHQSINTASVSGKNKNPVTEIEDKLENLSKAIGGYRRSFEYIQDYLNMHGVKIFQEELIRIINYNVEMECNAYIQKQIPIWQSKFQSTTIPIPNQPLPDDRNQFTSCNFIGRLASEILQCTDPNNTNFIELKGAWFDKRPPYKIVLDNSLFSKILDAISPAGIVGLDRLYSYMIANDLKENLEKLQYRIANDKMWSDALQTLTKELETLPIPEQYENNPLKFYANYHQRWLKVWPKILDWILRLGQKQILRQQLAFKLNRSSKCNAKNLQSTLETFNKALLNEWLKAENDHHFKNCELIQELNDYLSFIGSIEPFEQVHITTRNSHNISLFFTLFIIAHLGRLQFNQQLPVKSSKDYLNPCLFVYGLITVFRQYHDNVRNLFITYLSEFIIKLVGINISEKNELNLESFNTLQFLELFVQRSKIPYSVLTKRIPIVILNQYKYLYENHKK